jgi:hypothetical protein
VFNVGATGFWNGKIWVAGGNGGNSLAYSYDGCNWKGLGTSIFTSCNRVHFNGTIWVAVGSGTSFSIAYSYDGIAWTGVANSNTIFTSQGLGVAWNGNTFLASGNGGNVLATSTNGISWFGVTDSSVSSWRSIGAGASSTCATNGPLWVVGTNNNMIYSYDITGRTGWNAVSNYPFYNSGAFSATFGICWNGTIWVAGGYAYAGSANTIAYSTNGITWTGLGNSVFPSSCYGFCWNGTRFVAFDYYSTYTAYSADGKTWYTSQIGMTHVNGAASNPGVGAFVAPSAMILNNNGISGNGIAKSQTLEIVSSDPYFQQGFDNMSVTVKQSIPYNTGFTTF